MSFVLDASAVLAFLGGEPGAEVVETALAGGVAYCSVVNWAEVAQKVRGAGADWGVGAAVLHSFGVILQPATVEDAELAATLWVRGSALSLADRFCLALGQRLNAQILTADSAWGAGPHIQQIR